jgi:NADH-quinone oxidoreductase subunit N
MLQEQLQHITEGLRGLHTEMLLSGLFIVIILTDLIGKKYKTFLTPAVFFIGVSAIIYFEYKSYYFQVLSSAQPVLSGMIYPDRVGTWMKMFFSVAALLTVVFERLSYKRQHEGIGEFYALIIAIHIGLNLMVVSSNLLIAWLALEMVSICSYVLTAYKFDSKSAEASMKYILFGAFSSCLAVYGISWVYGITGTINFTDPNFISGIAFADQALVTVVFFLIFSALLFKLSAVPFHWWTPDVYQAAPTAVVAFLSTAPKAAGLILLVRILYPLIMVEALLLETEWLFMIITSATIFIGNVAALRQTNLRRMLAYSAVSHSGYLLMLVTVLNDLAVQVMAFYLCVYLFMNFAAFFIVDIAEKTFGNSETKSFRGLGTKLTLLPLLITFLMLSLAGLPPTAGFFAKFQLFSVLWNKFEVSGNQVYVYLILIGLTNTVIGLFYYLKVPYYMYFKKWENQEGLTLPSIPSLIFVTLLSTPLLVIFLQPELFFRLLEKLKLYV